MARIHDTHSTSGLEFKSGAFRYPVVVLAIGLGAEILILLVMKTVHRRGFQSCFLWLGPLGWLVLYSSCLSSVLIGSAFPVMVGIIGMGFNLGTATASSLLLDMRVDQSRRETAQSLILRARDRHDRRICHHRRRRVVIPAKRSDPLGSILVRGDHRRGRDHSPRRPPLDQGPASRDDTTAG